LMTCGGNILKEGREKGGKKVKEKRGMTKDKEKIYYIW
jgi:hypothetical protein